MGPHFSPIGRCISSTAMLRLTVLAATVSLVLCRVAPDLRDIEYQCPGGWKLVEDSCFRLGDKSRSWSDAQNYCRNVYGANLATINSQRKQDSIKAILRANTWIGLNDLSKDHRYVWADGSSYGYKSWASGEPSNSGTWWFFGQQGEREDCVEMRKSKSYKWNDEHCTDKKQFLCSSPAEIVTTTTTTTTPTTTTTTTPTTTTTTTP